MRVCEFFHIAWGFYDLLALTCEMFYARGNKIFHKIYLLERRKRRNLITHKCHSSSFHNCIRSLRLCFIIFLLSNDSDGILQKVYMTIARDAHYNFFYNFISQIVIASRADRTLITLISPYFVLLDRKWQQMK